MARHADGEVWVQLATRVPRLLHLRLKLFCVRNDQSLMDFVVDAVKVKLANPTSRRVGRRRVNG